MCSLSYVKKHFNILYELFWCKWWYNWYFATCDEDVKKYVVRGKHVITVNDVFQHVDMSAVSNVASVITLNGSDFL